MLEVTITDRDQIPCARLLDALTKANLLSGKLTWQEYEDKIVLYVDTSKDEGGPNVGLEFQRNRFQVKNV